MTYESWITQFVEQLSEYFNLQGWIWKLDFSDEEHPEGAYAATSFNAAYQYANVTFYRQSKEDYESGELERLVLAVIHELTHAFLNPFHDFVEPYLSKTTEPFFVNMLETQTQKLTMVFLKQLPKSIVPRRPSNGKHNSTRADNTKKPAVH
jgi:hypothetical protein